MAQRAIMKEESDLSQGFRKDAEVIKTAEVVIRGLRPLLMSSPKEMYPGGKKVGKSKIKQGKTRISTADAERDEVDPEFEAEKRAYRDLKGRLCVEADAILANLYNAARLAEQLDSKGKKVRGSTAVQSVKASVTMDDDFIPLLDAKGRQVKNYEVHAKRVRNKFTGGAQIRFRPLIRSWGLKYRISWNPFMYGLSEGALRKIVAAGGRIGLLDWRPRHGIYELVSFKMVDNGRN